jgi:hypothetical protein
MGFLERLVLREHVDEAVPHVISVPVQQLAAALAEAEDVDDPRVPAKLSQASSPEGVVGAPLARR